MKKLSVLGFGLICAIFLAASTASAVSLGDYDVGVVVPIATHNGSNVDTVVGLTCNATTTTTVYWVFFSEDSQHLYDGSFNMTPNDAYSFSMNAVLGNNLVDQGGYLVFTAVNASIANPTTNNLSSNVSTIHANAFLVDTSANDAIFIPVLPLTNQGGAGSGTSDFAANVPLNNLNAASIIDAHYGINAGVNIDIHYWIDPSQGATTSMVIWTVQANTGSQTVNIYDNDENRTSITMCRKHTELIMLNPANTGASAGTQCQGNTLLTAADFTAWPSSYTGGFLTYTMPNSGVQGHNGSGFAYSYVSSTNFSAAQTLIPGERQ